MLLICALFDILALATAAAAADVRPSSRTGDTDLYVLAFGGKTTTTSSTNHVVESSVEGFSTFNFHTRLPGLTPMPHALWNFGSAVYNNIVYVVGGRCAANDTSCNDFWSYNVSTNHWTIHDRQRLPRNNSSNCCTSALVANNTLFAIPHLNSTITYALDLGTVNGSSEWRIIQNKNFVSARICTVAVDDRDIYTLFDNGTFTRSGDGARSWVGLAPAPFTYRESVACVVLQNNATILVAGGIDRADRGSTALNEALLYNIAHNSWSQATSMITGRAEFQLVAAPVTNGVLACGGDETSDTVLRTCEAYDLYSDQWLPMGQLLNQSRAFFGMQVLVLTPSSSSCNVGVTD